MNAPGGPKSIADFVARLSALGVALWLEGEKLRYRAPAGVLTPEALERLKANKDEVVALLVHAQIRKAAGARSSRSCLRYASERGVARPRVARPATGPDAA